VQRWPSARGYASASLVCLGRVSQLVVKLPAARVDELIASGRGERSDPRPRSPDEGVGRDLTRARADWLALRTAAARTTSVAERDYLLTRAARLADGEP
jgi:hypothetical protein